MFRILYENPDGSVSQCIPAPAARLPGESDLEFVSRIQTQDVPAGVRQIVVDESDLPAANDAVQHRRWRAAWRIGRDRTVEVDVGEARKVRQAELEAAQSQRLRQLWEQSYEADLNGDQQAKALVTKQRRAARDLNVATALANITDLDALDRHVPQELQ